MDKVSRFLDLPFKHHLVAGTIIRVFLILYGDYHDSQYDVPYTDVDYKVFTDAARHVYNGQSPYDRHTYRYSPIIAYLMLPNIMIHKNFGKILFSVFDILITIALKVMVEQQLKSKCNASKIGLFCSLVWLYNPLSIGISTRGNADSVPCFFVILSLLFLQTDVISGSIQYSLSGVLLGISIHLRLYPLAFSFPMYLSLGVYKADRGEVKFTHVLMSLMPNVNQLRLAASCIATLFLLTISMYFFYGYAFLFETYIYHLFRKDTRHNFSILFYYSYLTMDDTESGFLKQAATFFLGTLLFCTSLTFGTEKKTLPFALFCQSVVMVAFNSVITSQYFIWFLSLLPLILPDLKMTLRKGFVAISIWIVAQAAWLFFAYLLEFEGRELFILVWMKSVVFFCVNCIVLISLIISYNPGYGLGYRTFVSKEKVK